MGRHTWQSHRAHVRNVAGKDDELGRLWGIEACERCGRTIVLGEQFVRRAVRGRATVLCPDCLEPAAATPTWIAAPFRLSLTPVPLTHVPVEESQAA